MKFLGLVWSNLKRKKLRTALTLLSIFIAFLLFGFLHAMKEGLTAGVSMAHADRLIVRHKVSLIQTLPVSYTQRIAGLPGVDAVAYQTWFGGIYQDPKNFIATFPVDPESYLDLYPEFKLTPNEKAAWLRTRDGAVVGRSAADKFGWKIGDRVPFTSPIWGTPANAANWEFEIVGILEGAKKSTDTNMLLFQYTYFDESREREKGQVGWYAVRVKNADDATAIAKRIDEEFANSPYETKAEPEGAFAAGFAQQVGDIGTIIMAVLGAVFFTILLVAGNTMSQTVRERTEELGVLKAMGFPNGLVLTLVLMESCLIALLGGLAGLGLAWGLLAAGNPIPNILPLFYVPNSALVTGSLFALLLGLAAGAVPAVQAMRLRISEALRRNG